jgi:hypothetical protein
MLAVAITMTAIAKMIESAAGPFLNADRLLIDVVRHQYNAPATDQRLRDEGGHRGGEHQEAAGNDARQGEWNDDGVEHPEAARPPNPRRR